MVIYVRCRSYGTWFPRTGRSSSLRGFSPIAIIRRRTTVPRYDLFSYVLDRTPRRCYLYAEHISRLFSRHRGTYVPLQRDTIIQRHLSTFHTAIHRTRLSGEIGCIVNALRESVLADGTHRKRGCVVCSVCVCRTKRATSRVTATKQIPQARVDIQLARNYRIVNSLSGFSR